MNRLRVVYMLFLLGGLPASTMAQSILVTTSPASPVTYGTPVTLFANVYGDNNCSGSSVYFFDGISNGVLIGFATLVLTAPFPAAQCMAVLPPASQLFSLSAGTHQLTATYIPGDYAPGFTLVVNPAPTSVVSVVTSPNPSTTGQALTLTAHVSPILPANLSGIVDFVSGDPKFVGYISISVPVSNGVATATADPDSIPPGTYHFVARYHPGDGNYSDSVGASPVDQAVNIQPTTTSLQAVPAPSTLGQTVMLTATVSPSGAGIHVTGKVTFMDGSTTLGSPTLNAGAATFSTSTLSLGSHQLTASYGGDTNNAASVSSSVTEAVSQATTTSLQAPGTSTIGQTVALTATVLPPTAAGTVTFKDGATTIGSAGLNVGTAGISTSSLSLGSHSLTASYGGDATDLSSVSSSVTETVGQIVTTTSLQAAPASSTAGQTVVLTATVSPSSATGTVTFLDGSTSLGAAGLNAGTAGISTSTLTAGNHTLTASYAGDTNDAASTSSPVTESVAQPATTPTATTLTASPNPSAPGQSVTLTATVTPAAAAGTVSFMDGATSLGTGSLSNGAATLSTSVLSSGSHSLTASYAGNNTYAPSFSPPVTQSVGKLTTTTVLTSAPNPSAPGQSVTLTAVVTPGNPTGTVMFLDGANPLGTSSLVNGVATFSTSTLSTASHSLTASYAGDTNNAASVSAAVNQSVTPGGGGRTITSLIPSSAAAGGAAFTLTVDGTGFTAGAAVQWNGAPLPTTLINATQVTAAVPASLIASPGVVIITVATPGGTTGGAAFLVGSQTQPAPVSDTPASGVGTAQMFTFQFADPAGYQSLGVVNVLINNFLDGRNACYLAYVVPSNTLVLVDDGGDAGGPYAGSIVLGSSDAIRNSQCVVTLASAVSSGTTLTLALNIAFKPAFGGNRILYMAARDQGTGNSDWQALGVWQAPFTPSGTIVVAGVSPGREAAPPATSQAIYITLTDNKGPGDFGVVDVLINRFIDGRQACYLAFVAATNTLILLNDGGDGAGAYAGSMALNGGPGTIQNSQCMVSGAGSAVTSIANTLTLTLNITFKSAFTGNRVIYAAGRDAAGGNNTDWQAVATFTVQ